MTEAMARALEILRLAGLEPFTETQREHQIRRAVARPRKMTPSELRAGPALDGLYLLTWIGFAFTESLETFRSIRRLLQKGHAPEGAPPTLLDCIDALVDEILDTSEPYNRIATMPLRMGRRHAPSYYELIGQILVDLVRIEESELPGSERVAWLKDVDVGRMMSGLQHEIARVGPDASKDESTSKTEPRDPPENVQESRQVIPRSLSRTEKWVLDVLRQEPDRAFKTKDLLGVRRRRDQAPCPVERSALCEALMMLRTREALTYAKRSYMHKT